MRERERGCLLQLDCKMNQTFCTYLGAYVFCERVEKGFFPKGSHYVRGQQNEGVTPKFVSLTTSCGPRKERSLLKCKALPIICLCYQWMLLKNSEQSSNQWMSLPQIGSLSNTFIGQHSQYCTLRTLKMLGCCDHSSFPLCFFSSSYAHNHLTASLVKH